MTKNKKIIFSILIALTIATFLPAVVLAASSDYECHCTGSGGNDYTMNTYSSQTECQTKCTTKSDGDCDGYTNPQCKAASSGTSGSATKGSYLTNPLGTTDAPALIGTIIKSALGIVGSIALLMFIYGGFLWLTSAGSADKITKGKNVIVWAVIGLVVVFLSYTMVGFVIKSLTSK